METNCTDTEIQRVLNRSLILIPYPDNNWNDQIEVCMTKAVIISLLVYALCLPLPSLHDFEIFLLLVDILVGQACSQKRQVSA